LKKPIYYDSDYRTDTTLLANNAVLKKCRVGSVDRKKEQSSTVKSRAYYLGFLVEGINMLLNQYN
jgi:hypothetical protein